jgi:transposase-like protein
MEKRETMSLPDPQVSEKARRRRFSAEYKLRILEEAERCTQRGELGSLLRREGLYSSLLSEWRKQRKSSSLRALEKKRGRKPRQDAGARRIAELERENQRLRRKLTQAETIIDVQKKLSQALGITAPEEEES